MTARCTHVRVAASAFAPANSPMLMRIRKNNFPQRTPREGNGGRSGIRTHGEFNPTFDFESSALNRAQPSFRCAALWAHLRRWQGGNGQASGQTNFW